MAEPKQKIHDGMFRKGDVATDKHRQMSINKRFYKGRMSREEADKLTPEERREIVWKQVRMKDKERDDKRKLSPYSKNPPRVRVEQKLEGDDNAKMIEGAMHFLFLPPVETDEDVYERTKYYFEYCAAEKRKPTIVGWANALGVSVTTLSDWEHKRSHGTSGRSSFVKKVKQMMEELLQNNALDGKINPVLFIFLAKAQYGYKDTQEHVIIQGEQFGDTLDPEEIKRQIANSLPKMEYEELPESTK